MKLLVISTLPDPHIEMVKVHLGSADHVYVFDPSLLHHEELTYAMDGEVVTIHYAGHILSDADVVWFRKPLLIPEKSYPVAEEHKQLVYPSYMEFVTWLYSALEEKPWISVYWNIKKASSKPFQLKVAHDVGMLIPKTIITNASEKARSFFDSHKVVVAKPLNISFVRTEKALFANYATVIRHDQGIDFSGLANSPYIFQQEIKGVDVRVTVIGTEVFACRIIKTGSLTSNRDWRAGIYQGGLTLVVDTDFPTGLVERCVTLVKRLGLEFGTIDFIQQEDTGQYWFLEINPNGQWAFVELETGLPLSKSMVKLMKSFI